MQEKNLRLDRTVFFCDAVVAIAITLLAFNLKIEHTENGTLTFADILHQWKTFAAFFLSFINIANFWKAHHSFYAYIKKMDEKLLWYNIHEGQKECDALNYAPLSKAATKAAETVLKEATFGGKAIL